MNLRALLSEAKKDYEKKLMNDEWSFTKFRESILENIDESNCFETINNAVMIIIKEEDNYLVYELLVLLNDLIRKSNTTEIPNKLEDNLEALTQKFKGDDNQEKMWKEILDYYLINTF